MFPTGGDIRLLLMWFKFIVPLGPFFYLYAKSIKEKISWCFYYLIPFFSVCCFYDVSVFAVFTIIVMIYSAYDIGYIYNNAETIKKEIAPTLRFSVQELAFYESNKLAIYFFKIFISVGCAYILFFQYNYNFIILFAVILYLIIVFLLYNSVRGTSNFYIQFFLSIGRYSIPLYILTEYNVEVLLISILLFPLPNFLERTKTKKNNLPFVIKDTSLFRFVYYLVVFTLCYICSSSLGMWSLSLSIYFLVYRFFYFLLDKFKR
ncbi:WbuO family protein [Buttiauxella noackiae ATCC 51607]|uniref:WbuO family protein n=1 Tax=Buttiauxella noackiae ATCC 51607 TaxID=1354255 RepID=A0A1B7HQK7_9ENTR|nr:WbuO family protein [Buttiauxella noackiae ATCC 51607]